MLETLVGGVLQTGGMSDHENEPFEIRPAPRHELVEKGAGFVSVPEVPPEWEPPSAALIMEPAPAPEPKPAPQAPSGDS